MDRGGDLDEAYRVHDRGVGCTVAREAARRWRASPACTALAAGACRLPGATCQAVRGGEFNVLVSARCTVSARPGGVVEFVHYQPWLQPPPSTQAPDDSLVYAWAINSDCSAVAAFPLDTLISPDSGDEGPCGGIFLLGREVTCAPAGGYRCRCRAHAVYSDNAGFSARRVEIADSFRAVEIALLRLRGPVGAEPA